jgi:hypothetical protein
MRNCYAAFEAACKGIRYLLLLGLLPSVVAAVTEGGDSDNMGTQQQVLRVSVQTPNPCWDIEITAVYALRQELLVVSELQEPAQGEACIQVVGQAEDEIALEIPPLRVKHVIIGRTWDQQKDAAGWGPAVHYVYLTSKKELEGMIVDAQRLH